MISDIQQDASSRMEKSIEALKKPLVKSELVVHIQVCWTRLWFLTMGRIHHYPRLPM